MADFDLFFLTDGRDFINLRAKTGGVFLAAWQPGIKEAKGGGVWQDSPLADGRVLVDRPFGNATEQLSLIIGAGGQEETIYAVQTIRRLLQKAVNYGLTQWQTEPVWIMTRARRETNIRYAVILDYRAPGEANPFADPFDGDIPIVPFPLLLERGDWMANPPGEADCLPGSTLLEVGEDATYSPTQDSDDAYINSTNIFAGPTFTVGSQLSQSLRAAIRFQNVLIPQAATILSAVLRLTAAALPTGTDCNIRIRFEDVDSAAAFSTYADFAARAETTAFVDWDNLSSAMTIGERVSTPDISAPLQEVIDRAGFMSTNDIVLFLDDNASSLDNYRRFAAYENTLLLPPTLEITFVPEVKTGTFGQEATCDNANFIGNRRSGILTHIWHYDASTLTFSPDLLGESLPYALLPTTPAANDLLIFMSEASNPLSAPIASVVFDILTPMSGVTGNFEYWDGAAWQNLPASKTPDFGLMPFASEGINSIHARQPVDMATVGVNTITGWAIRFKVTAVSSPVAPVQQFRHPYTISNNDILIEEANLGGDLPPLLTLKMYNRADDTGGLTLVPIAISRVIMGLRSVDRGPRFTSVINLGDEYNPDGVTISVGAVTAFDDDSQAPTGRVAIFSPVGVIGLVGRVTATIDSDLCQDYKGVFKPFVRVKQVGGAAGDIGVRVRVAIYSASNVFYTSDTLYTSTVDEIEVMEFREFTLPPNLDIIKGGESIGNVLITIDALNNNATPPELNIVDLFLIPVDEFSLDVFDALQSGVSAFGNPDKANRLLELDSAFRLKRQQSALLMLEQGPIPLLNYAINANGPLVLQPSGDQKLHFLFARNNAGDGWDSYPENAVSLEMFIQKRYFSMRGNR